MEAAMQPRSSLVQSFDPDLEAALATVAALDDVADIEAALQAPPPAVPVVAANGFALAHRMPQRHPARTIMEAAQSDPVGVMANILLHDFRAGRDTTDDRLRVFFTRAEIAQHKGAARALAIRGLGGIEQAKVTLDANKVTVADALDAERDIAQ
jgi:hypothetical protein